jgi:hypothetical protein
MGSFQPPQPRLATRPIPANLRRELRRSAPDIPQVPGLGWASIDTLGKLDRRELFVKDELPADLALDPANAGRPRRDTTERGLFGEAGRIEANRFFYFRITRLRPSARSWRAPNAEEGPR